VSFALAIFQLNIFALITGIRALKKINQKGDRGRGLALSAIVLGAVQTVIIILFVVNPGGFAYGLGFMWGLIQNFFEFLG